MGKETEEILRLLIENQEKKFSIRQISLLRKINYKSAYNAVMKLKKENIVLLERAGNTINCSFIRRIHPLVFKVEYKRRESLLRDKDFKVIYSRLNELKFPFIILLFGSHARNKAGKHSDIDLLIITEHHREVESALSLIPLEIHMTAINYKEFTSMLKSREFSVVSEALKNNIILTGIEEYYRILENA